MAFSSQHGNPLFTCPELVEGCHSQALGIIGTKAASLALWRFNHTIGETSRPKVISALYGKLSLRLIMPLPSSTTTLCPNLGLARQVKDLACRTAFEPPPPSTQLNQPALTLSLYYVPKVPALSQKISPLHSSRRALKR